MAKNTTTILTLAALGLGVYILTRPKKASAYSANGGGKGAGEPLGPTPGASGMPGQNLPGGSGTQSGNAPVGSTDPITGGTQMLPGLPVSDAIIFDTTCTQLAVYPDQRPGGSLDQRITNRYWDIVAAGVMDVDTITAEILRMDSPQCQWPPPAGASQQVLTVWTNLRNAVAGWHQANAAAGVQTGGTLFG